MDMWWNDLEIILVCILFLHILIFENLWFMLLGFSCDGTCLSWIEFIFDLSMWPLYWYIYLNLLHILWRLWWWYCIHLCYDMIHFMMIMHVIMYTLWCWCTPIQYDVHAYHSVMMLSYALWYIFDDDDAYPMMMLIHTHDDDAWRCMPYDQWKQSRTTWWVTGCDEVYKDVHEQT